MYHFTRTFLDAGSLTRQFTHLPGALRRSGLLDGAATLGGLSVRRLSMVLQHSLFGRAGRLNFEAASREGGSEITEKEKDEACGQGQKVSPVPLIQWSHVELYGSDTTVASAAVELQGPKQGGKDGKLRLGGRGFASLAASNLATKSLAERRMAFYRGERESGGLTLTLYSRKSNSNSFPNQEMETKMEVKMHCRQLRC